MELLGGLFLRWAWGSSGSAKMLEAILFLRWGVVLSSVPKDKLESPPGGRSTLKSEKGRIIMTDWYPATRLPSPHTLGQTNNHMVFMWHATDQLHKKKKTINSEIKHDDASSYTQPSPYSTLTLSYTCHTHKKHKLSTRTPNSKPRLSDCQTDSHNRCPAALQLTPIESNHRVSRLAAASQHRFLCSDTWGLVSVADNEWNNIKGMNQIWRPI